MFKFPLIQAVLNVTPDSFSDGGRFNQPSIARDRCQELMREGAALIDIGGESTRPFSQSISLQEELDRVLPVLEVLKGFPIPFSIDTTKYEVARAAIEYGAKVLNDVSGGSDPRYVELLHGSDRIWILMHKQGTPEQMQKNPTYAKGVVQEVFDFFRARVDWCLSKGLRLDQLWLDPGIGFGKTLQDNLALLRNIPLFTQIGCKIAIGTSRKSFIAASFPGKDLPPDQRLGGTIATNLWALQAGAEVFRVHDVKEVQQAIELWRMLTWQNHSKD